jgi:hypothetical protein
MPMAATNALSVRAALRQYAPDLQKELTAEWRTILKPIVVQARGYVPAESPMRGWKPRSFSEAKFPTYNASVIRAGITYKTTPSRVNSRGFQSLVRIQNQSAVGAIYETAGRKNGQGQDWVGPKAGGASKGVSRSVNPYAGNQFISNLGQLYGSLRGSDHRRMGRLIYRAWANSQGRANAGVIRAIESTTKKFNARASQFDLKRAA